MSSLVYAIKAEGRSKNYIIRDTDREVNEIWVHFHARSRFACSAIPEGKWGTTRSLTRSGLSCCQFNSALLELTDKEITQSVDYVPLIY